MATDGCEIDELSSAARKIPMRDIVTAGAGPRADSFRSARSRNGIAASKRLARWTDGQITDPEKYVAGHTVPTASHSGA